MKIFPCLKKNNYLFIRWPLMTHQLYSNSEIVVGGQLLDYVNRDSGVRSLLGDNAAHKIRSELGRQIK